MAEAVAMDMPRDGTRARRAAFAFGPLALAVLAIAIAGLAGVHARGLIGTLAEPFLFGYFVERFPLFVALVIYAAARVVLAATIAPGGPLYLRLALLPIALGLVLAGALYPTTGGIVVRAAYFTGGMAFLQGTPALPATAIGALVSTGIFASLMGIAVMIARLSPRVDRRAAGAAALRFLALAWAALVVAAPTALGAPLLGEWPIWPMSLPETAAAATLVALALAPHALIGWATGR